MDSVEDAQKSLVYVAVRDKGEMIRDLPTNIKMMQVRESVDGKPQRKSTLLQRSRNNAKTR
jgi:hypothetical protein